MDLTLDQAALLLGCTVRQVRYRVQQGTLPAHREGRRWLIRREDLPRADGQATAQDRDLGRLRATVDRALDLPPRPIYTLSQLRAFQAGAPLLASTAPLGVAEATRTLRAALHRLAVGFHRFHREEKLAALREARDLAATAAAELMLDGRPEAAALAKRIEEELLPAVGGLLRRAERRERP